MAFPVNVLATVKLMFFCSTSPLNAQNRLKSLKLAWRFVLTSGDIYQNPFTQEKILKFWQCRIKKFDLKFLLIMMLIAVQFRFVFCLLELPLCLITLAFCNVKNVPKSLSFHFDDDAFRSCSCANTLQMQSACTGFRTNFLWFRFTSHFTGRAYFTFY
jgi:hypothetical protein